MTTSNLPEQTAAEEALEETLEESPVEMPADTLADGAAAEHPLAAVAAPGYPQARVVLKAWR